MPSLILLFSLFFFSFASVAQSSSPQEAQNQEIRYISDDLFIFLHAGPARDFRIVGSISAGETVSLLQVDREAGYAQVQDNRERIGWVESKFVSRNPSIRVSLENAIDELQMQKESVLSMQKTMNTALSELAESEQQKLNLNRHLTKTLELNAELERRFIQKGRSDQMQWFTRGTVLALISVFVGFLLGMFARKKSKSNPLL